MAALGDSPLCVTLVRRVRVRGACACGSCVCTFRILASCRGLKFEATEDDFARLSESIEAESEQAARNKDAIDELKETMKQEPIGTGGCGLCHKYDKCLQRWPARHQVAIGP